MDGMKIEKKVRRSVRVIKGQGKQAGIIMAGTLFALHQLDLSHLKRKLYIFAKDCIRFS